MRACPVVAISLTTGEKHYFSTIKEAALVGGFNRDNISRCIRGTSRSHAGFTFKATGRKNPTKPNNLTKRVGKLRRQGLSNDAIAVELGLKVTSVRAYASRAIIAGLCESRKTGKRV